MKKQNENNGFGIASLVTSIVGFVGFLMPYIAIWFSIMAIVFASLQKKNSPSGLATAGLVVGIIGILGNLLWLGVIGLMLGAGMI